MNAIAEMEESASRARAATSAPGRGTRISMIRRGSRGELRRLPRPRSSTSPESSQSLALAMQPLPDRHADTDEDGRPEEPGHESLGDRADAADRPAAAVIRMLRPIHVRDERVELAIGYLLPGELRHHVR